MARGIAVFASSLDDEAQSSHVAPGNSGPATSKNPSPSRTDQEHYAQHRTVIGDALIDQIQTTGGSSGFVGGARLNVAVGLARPGVLTTLIATVGADDGADRIRELSPGPRKSRSSDGLPPSAPRVQFRSASTVSQAPSSTKPP